MLHRVVIRGTFVLWEEYDFSGASQRPPGRYKILGDDKIRSKEYVSYWYVGGDSVVSFVIISTAA